mmetsp:Transcript_104021/g.294716  ORF Transcript_104021/g.294716 Transcript_104021/m.294716 type:complete len:672 (-) Transcript_104021:154-2169(-)
MSDFEGSDDGAAPDAYKAPVPLPRGIRKEVIKEADSKSFRTPKAGDEVTVDYRGSFESDGSEFDSSHSRDAPFVFTLGKGDVIKGWDLGVATMKKGEVAKFTLQPEFAYGEQGSPPKIPPNATLVFVVELISWVSKDDLFGDESVIKALLEEGSGWENPKKGAEVRMSLRAVGEDGKELQSLQSGDYVIGSDSLGPLSNAVDKALRGMLKNEKCSLTCAKGCTYKEHGEVTVELHLEEVYEIKDVSLLSDNTVQKKQIREGEDHEKPDDGYAAILTVEAATDGEVMLPGFSGPKDLHFVCGNGDVCDALECAAIEMKKGERAMVTCTAPAKACEAMLGLSTVTAAKVVFTVELKYFEKNLRRWNMSNEEKLRVAGARKEVGAKLFKAQRYELALDKYKKVATMVHDGELNKTHDELKQQAAELKRLAELNKAACYLKLGDNTNTLATCNSILKEDHCNVKALFRRAKAHYGRNEHVEALRDLERVLELDPANSEAKALVPHARRAQKMADKESRSTFSKMCQGFGKLGFEKENKKPAEEEVKREEEPPKEKPDTVAMTFRIDTKLQPGETLRVVGSPEVLGSWDAANSIEMRLLPPKWEPPVGSGRAPPEVHMWEANVDIPQGEGRIEYKYVVRGPKGDQLEGGCNHAMQLDGLGGSRQRVTDFWRKGEPQ